MSRPSAWGQAAAWPAARSGGGRRRGRTDPLARGPSVAGRERSLDTTLPGPRSHAVLASHPRRPHTRPERAKGRPASPSPEPSPPRPPRSPAQSRSQPLLRLSLGASRVGTRLGRGRKVADAQALRSCALPPALAVKPSAFPWEVLWSHPEAGRRSRACPWHQRAGAGHSQHPLSYPDPL